MDKYEYKVRADEIKQLISQGEYGQAVEIADTIDWRRVRSVMMLCTISDLYKINRRYEEARDMLLLAYELRPGGRTICYSLCELSIKMEEFVQAVEFYKEFVQAAPKDSGRYILQYKLYEAQDVGLEERIEVLEELKKRDYREKWAYELAYLYHRVGLATKCVEECDEMILWFGEGRYVIKAMELKMLHQPLSAEQQEKYDHRFDTPEENVQETYEENEAAEPTAEAATDSLPNIEFETAEIPFETQELPADEQIAEGEVSGDTQIYQAIRVDDKGKVIEQNPNQGDTEEFDIHVKTVDVSQYNTINLQAELAEGLREILQEEMNRNAQKEKENQDREITADILAPMLSDETKVIEKLDELSEENGDYSGEEYPTEDYPAEEYSIEEYPEENYESDDVYPAENGEEYPSENEDYPVEEEVQAEFLNEDSFEQTEEEQAPRTEVKSEVFFGETQELNLWMENETYEMPTQPRSDNIVEVKIPTEMAKVLSQQSDGQIRLVVPETENIEKQITGQMSIEDILAEWERLKRDNEEKRKEEVRAHVMEQTGTMFNEFEASVRDGLLEKLENGEISIAEGLSQLDALEGVQNAETVEETEAAQENEDAQEIEAVQETEIAKEAEAVQETEVALEVEEAQEIEAAQETEAVKEVVAETPVEKVEETIQSAEISSEVSSDTQNLEAEIAEVLAQLDKEDAEEKQHAENENAEIENTEAVNEEDEVEELEEISENEEETSEAEEKAEAVEEEISAEEDKEDDGEESNEETEKDSESKEAQNDKSKLRKLTVEEKELYAPFIQSKASREQLIRSIDNISMAAYTGNVIITGSTGIDTVGLAKNIVREIQISDSNFSGKVAKISGETLNKKNVENILNPLKNGALIIERASGMNEKTMLDLHKCLQRESFGIVVFIEDVRKAISQMLERYPWMKDVFNARVDIEALSNDALVAFGKHYAKELEYTIDDLGVLALHTRIEEIQTSDHAVTTMEVKDMVDEAIRHVNKKNLSHFFDILFSKRYDEEDMIILTEKDFM